MHCMGVLRWFSPLITDSVSLLSYLNRLKLQLVRLGLRKNNILIVKIGEHVKLLPVEGYWNSITAFSRHLSEMAWDCVTLIENSWVCLWEAVCIRWSCWLTSAYVTVFKENLLYDISLYELFRRHRGTPTVSGCSLHHVSTSRGGFTWRKGLTPGFPIGVKSWFL